MNPDRALVGYATPYGVASHDGVVFEARHFARFLSFELGAGLCHDHQMTITSGGIEPSIGAVRRFASVDYPIPGLLALAYFDDGPGASRLLNAIRQDVRRWALSVGTWPYEDGRGSQGIGEVSLTTVPAFDDARVLDVGPNALVIWEMLTGQSCKEMSRGTQAVP